MAEQYYALCVEGDALEEAELAYLDMGQDEDGRLLGLAVYTSPSGKAQQAHVERYAERVVDPMPPYEKVHGNLVVKPVDHAGLFAAIQPATPNTVLVNGRKVAASRFKASLQP